MAPFPPRARETSIECAMETVAAPPDVFDVFCSYHGEDRPLVERIALDLRAAQVQPRLDKWDLRPGSGFQAEFGAALRCRSCAVFVGRTVSAHGRERSWPWRKIVPRRTPRIPLQARR